MMEGHCMVDGGVFASNPALCAYAQARNMYPEEEEFLVVSLGTGLQVHKRLCPEMENWGIVDWAIPIIDVMLNSSSETVNYQMRALNGIKNYVRFQVQLDENAGGMDDTSEKNIRMLDTLAQKAVKQHSAAIDRLCYALINRRPKAIPIKQYNTGKGNPA
jgi:hypothetical protein